MIHIDADRDYGPQYTSVDLLLDPEGDVPRVYTYARIGSGVPEAVWHKRHLQIGRVSPMVVGSSLQTWLQDHVDEIAAFAATYFGTECDVHGNLKGQWLESLDDLEVLDVDYAVNEGEIASYQDAMNYLEADQDGAISVALAAESIEDAAEEIEGEAKKYGIYLTGVTDALVELLALQLETLDPGDDPELFGKLSQLLEAEYGGEEMAS